MKTMLQGMTGLVLLAIAACGTEGRPLETNERAAPSTRAQTSAMMNDDNGGLDCSNCVGGECAQLHCFENWTHGGGGGGGPYEGGGGGGWGGGGGGGGGSDPQCTTDVLCVFACNDDVMYPCWSRCLEGSEDAIRRPGYAACRKGCDAAWRACYERCKTCR